MTHHDLGLLNSVKKLIIDGRLVDAVDGRTFETRNPATGELLATISEGDARDIDLAVAAARRAFEGPWSKFTPFQRQECILKFADLIDQHFEEFSLLDTLDMGAPISFTRGRRQRAIGMLRFYAGMCTVIQGGTLPNSLPGDVFSYTLKEPVGVVGAITPWNAPLTSTIWKIGPVLATGCTMVLKPSEEAPLTALRLGELALEAGIPPGVINVVPGFGHTAGAALAAHLDVDKVAFTGSDVTGRKVIEASKGNIKRLMLELGGKSPDIVFADADLDKAVPGTAMGIFGNSGQICSAGSRLLVERTIYDDFVERVSVFAKSLRVGNGMDTATQIGPVVSARQMDRVRSYIDIGIGEGAAVSAGGEQMTEGALAGGYFIQPTVLSNVGFEMRVAQEEIFGPVVTAIPFDSQEDAIRIANSTVYGLGSGVWTRDGARAHVMAKAIRSGTVWINCYGALDPVIPFGGYKMSGYGRESSTQHVEDYLHTKAVVMQNG
ncbi:MULTISPECIES: aldehyde dehydrogenase family protein [Rhizobium/Agrobacterium group]|uniref:aldehyde dehydrogenase family protein n=1 Tax=Rhizobium/Agrobacterium group TaxID=227290 RepID=UPI0008FB9A78|nr:MULTISPECIES: aldehyde dehydrogenase family protein [Rhizobium/Agrobacterium group]MCF1464403.1 aldehyde dehydrogenase family protein [Allorhizobium ampelinum]MCF1495344.1 aldehyde dehydrogenase family protein [Allorhizobium ampelinum]MUZ54209.1 aldehyde dehydrogenase family protein [Agrobacterium vitis]MUZ93892.1 aldehyde dehydrogenase family protein [Agrobacterium vitis]MVA41966.1 aldehyde dehydrogenase family protein [Agrobacterium vitis]